jgi:hypothetical protein
MEDRKIDDENIKNQEKLFEDKKKVSGYDFGKIKEVLKGKEITIEGKTEENKEKPKNIEETVNNLNTKEEILNKIDNIPLDDYEVIEIMGAVKLEPMVLYTKVFSEKRGKEDIGIPGFFDVTNKRFILLDGGPILSKNFDLKFSEFVDSKIKEK